jgi:hypothetical protein
MKKYYVYITVNLLNNRGYVGMTNGRKKYYRGSSFALNADIRKLGKENFSTTILGVFDTWQEAHYWEGFYVRTLKTHISQGGYNEKWNGGIYTDTPWNKGKKWDTNVIEKMKHPHKEYKIINERDKDSYLIGEQHPMYGKKHKEDSIELMKKNRAGIPAWNKGKTWSEKTKQKISNSKIGKKIKPFSEEHKQHLKDSWKNRKPTPKKICPYCNKSVDARNYKRWHGENCKERI